MASPASFRRCPRDDEGRALSPVGSRAQRTAMSPPTSAHRWLGRAAAALFLTGQLAVGLAAMGRDLRVAFGSAPLDVLGPARRRRVELVARHLPAQEALFVVLPAADPWYAGLWHRALYPRAVFVIQGAEELAGPRVVRLRAERGVRYAVVVGEPPTGLRLRDPIALPPEPGRPAAALGELAP